MKCQYKAIKPMKLIKIINVIPVLLANNHVNEANKPTSTTINVPRILPANKADIPIN